MPQHQQEIQRIHVGDLLRSVVSPSPELKIPANHILVANFFSPRIYNSKTYRQLFGMKVNDNSFLNIIFFLSQIINNIVETPKYSEDSFGHKHLYLENGKIPKFVPILELLKSKENLQIGVRVWIICLDPSIETISGELTRIFLANHVQHTMGNIPIWKQECVRVRTQEGYMKYVVDLQTGLSMINVNRLVEAYNENLCNENNPFSIANIFSIERAFSKTNMGNWYDRICPDQIDPNRYFDQGIFRATSFSGKFPFPEQTFYVPINFFHVKRLYYSPLPWCVSNIIKNSTGSHNMKKIIGLDGLTNETAFNIMEGIRDIDECDEINVFHQDELRNTNEFEYQGEEHITENTVLVLQQLAREVDEYNIGTSEIKSYVNVKKIDMLNNDILSLRESTLALQQDFFDIIRRRARDEIYSRRRREQTKEEIPTDSAEFEKLQRIYEEEMSNFRKLGMWCFEEIWNNSENLVGAALQSREWFKSLPIEMHYGFHWFPSYENLSLYGNLMVRIIDFLDIIEKIDYNFNPVILSIYAALSSLRYSEKSDDMLKFNLALYGLAGSGKSKALDTAKEWSFPGLIRIVSRQTPAAYLTEGDKSNHADAWDEAQTNHLGYDNIGRKIPEDGIIKQILTAGRTDTQYFSINEQTKKREMKEISSRASVSHIRLTNLRFPKECAAIKDRHMELPIFMIEKTYSQEQYSSLVKFDDSAFDSLLESVRMWMKISTYYVEIWENLIAGGMFPDIELKTFDITLANIIAEMKRQDMEIPSQRHQSQVRQMARNACMLTAINAEFFVFDYDLLYAERPKSFKIDDMEKLIARGVVTKEMAMDAFLRCSDIWFSPTSKMIVETVKHRVGWPLTSQRNLNFLPNYHPEYNSTTTNNNNSNTFSNEITKSNEIDNRYICLVGLRKSDVINDIIADNKKKKPSLDDIDMTIGELASTFISSLHYEFVQRLQIQLHYDPKENACYMNEFDRRMIMEKKLENIDLVILNVNMKYLLQRISSIRTQNNEVFTDNEDQQIQKMAQLKMEDLNHKYYVLFTNRSDFQEASQKDGIEGTSDIVGKLFTNSQFSWILTDNLLMENPMEVMPHFYGKNKEQLECKDNETYARRWLFTNIEEKHIVLSFNSRNNIITKMISEESKTNVIKDLKAIKNSKRENIPIVKMFVHNGEEKGKRKLFYFGISIAYIEKVISFSLLDLVKKACQTFSERGGSYVCGLPYTDRTTGEVYYNILETFKLEPNKGQAQIVINVNSIDDLRKKNILNNTKFGMKEDSRRLCNFYDSLLDPRRKLHFNADKLLISKDINLTMHLQYWAWTGVRKNDEQLQQIIQSYTTISSDYARFDFKYSGKHYPDDMIKNLKMMNSSSTGKLSSSSDLIDQEDLNLSDAVDICSKVTDTLEGYYSSAILHEKRKFFPHEEDEDEMESSPKRMKQSNSKEEEEERGIVDEDEEEEEVLLISKRSSTTEE